MEPLLPVVFVLILVLLMLSIYTFHKIRSVHLLLYEVKDLNKRESLNLFRQLEALYVLYRDLGLRHSLSNTRAKAGSPDFLVALARYVLEHKPTVVVECGSGVSTVVIARCLQLNGRGHLHSLEHLASFAELTRNDLRRHGLEEYATVVDAPLRSYFIGDREWQWYSTDQMPESDIDLLVIDGPPARTGRSVRYPAGPLLFRRLSRNGVVFADDAGRADEASVTRRWTEEFPEMKGEINLADYEKGLFIMTRQGE